MNFYMALLGLLSSATTAPIASAADISADTHDADIVIMRRVPERSAYRTEAHPSTNASRVNVSPAHDVTLATTSTNVPARLADDHTMSLTVGSTERFQTSSVGATTMVNAPLLTGASISAPLTGSGAGNGSGGLASSIQQALSPLSQNPGLGH